MLEITKYFVHSIPKIPKVVPKYVIYVKLVLCKRPIKLNDRFKNAIRFSVLSVGRKKI